ncbi:phosphotriesterase family protein [Paraconexibacter algicola]|uniref:Phosphotriesterase n=1 Tax=Paraconexibacter algicola TaxID=2133960 RepID=A0A2T4UIJ4_9ACTN|nr:phosphotriesterase [Paraconexibacter algicola]PTL59049.1 phosphotriesterase [Paraconexibacter algicola]
MPRSHVETTAGPVAASDLGRTLVHEHLLTVSEVVRTEWPHLADRPAEEEAALTQVRNAQEHGVRTWVDPAVMNLGRDAGLAKRVGEQTGMNMVLATGAYVYETLPRYFRFRDGSALADAFVHDHEHGIQGTGVKPAFLKCAVDEHGITEDVEKVLRAVADAHRRTGLPVMSHCRLGGTALGPEGPIPPSDEERARALEQTLRQIEILVDEGGVPANAVQVAHVGDCDALDPIERVLETGVWIGMDRFGLDIFNPSARRNEVVAELASRGYADRMMLGQDSCATIDWYPQEVLQMLAPRWHATLIFEEEIPAMQQLGVTDEQLATMLEANPAAWLSA